MRIGIIGNGNLGMAISSMLRRNGFYNFNISDVDKYKANMTNKENNENSDILFLCVKPIDVPSVLSTLHNSQNSKKILISPAAGVNIADIERYTNTYTVRIMPNLTIQYGKGIIPYYLKNGEELPNSVKQLFSGMKLLKCRNEDLLNLSTICNGSMPAYLAYFSREYVKFAVENGFSNSEAIAMQISALEGTLQMMQEHTFDQIASMVSSQKGVTQKGLRHLDELQVPTSLQSSLRISHDHLCTLKI